jgi:hypothetical protein
MPTDIVECIDISVLVLDQEKVPPEHLIITVSDTDRFQYEGDTPPWSSNPQLSEIGR